MGRVKKKKADKAEKVVKKDPRKNGIYSLLKKQFNKSFGSDISEMPEFDDAVVAYVSKMDNMSREERTAEEEQLWDKLDAIKSKKSDFKCSNSLSVP